MTIEDFFVRLIIAVVVGMVIGLERQLTGHAVSFKTSVLIAVGSLVFVATEIFIGSTDTRMAANVITGIGFLCSGVIFKNGASVNGLTTGATLWSTSALAVLIGYGYIEAGLVGTGVIIIANILNYFLEKKIHPIHAIQSANQKSFNMYVECLSCDVKKIKNVIFNEMPSKLIIKEFEVSTITGKKSRITVQIEGQENPQKEISSLCDKVMEKDVISVSYVLNDE